MLPVIETDHVGKGRALLIEQFKNRRVVQGYLDCLMRRAQDLENVFWDIINSRILDDATAAQLDSLGGLANEKRSGRNDDDFRAAIRLRIRVNRSKGRIADIIDVAMLADVAGTPRVTEYAFLGFEVEIYGQTGERYIAELLNKTRAATSYGILVASVSPVENVLRWDDAVAPVAGIETFGDVIEEFS